MEPQIQMRDWEREISNRRLSTRYLVGNQKVWDTITPVVLYDYQGRPTMPLSDSDTRDIPCLDVIPRPETQVQKVVVREPHAAGADITALIDLVMLTVNEYALIHAITMSASTAPTLFLCYIQRPDYDSVQRNAEQLIYESGAGPVTVARFPTNIPAQPETRNAPLGVLFPDDILYCQLNGNQGGGDNMDVIIVYEGL